MTLSSTQRTMVDAVAENFPATFGLRGFRGDVFRINRSASYVNDAMVVLLYTDVWTRFGWSSFAKGTSVELRSQVSTPQIREIAESLHDKFPGAWVQTDQEVEKILELRTDDSAHPQGGLWWRTHHLVRHLGGEA
jgi:hypothetical protein